MSKCRSRVWLAGLVVCLAISQSVQAGTPNVVMWFEATPMNAESSVVTQGQFGGDTVLGCNSVGGPAKCEWRISMMMDNSAAGAGDGIITGAVAADFIGDSVRHSIPDTDENPGNYPLNDYAFTSDPSPGTLATYKRVWVPVVDNGNGPEWAGVPTGVYSVLEFTLSSDFLPGESNIDGIGIANNNLFTVLVAETGTAPDTVVQFGDAPAFLGNDLGGFAADVIQFEVVPEPSVGVLMLLASGLVIRRRSRRPATR